MQQHGYPTVGPQITQEARYPAALNIPGDQYTPNPLGSSVQIPGAGGIVINPSPQPVALQKPLAAPLANTVAASHAPAKWKEQKLTYDANMQQSSLFWGNFGGVAFYVTGERGSLSVVDDKSRPLILGEGSFPVIVDGVNQPVMKSKNFDPDKLFPKLNSEYVLGTNINGKTQSIHPAAAQDPAAAQQTAQMPPTKTAKTPVVDQKPAAGEKSAKSELTRKAKASKDSGYDKKMIKTAFLWGKFGQATFYLVEDQGRKKFVDQHMRPVISGAGKFEVTVAGYNVALMAAENVDVARHFPQLNAGYIVTTSQEGIAQDITPKSAFENRQSAPEVPPAAPAAPTVRQASPEPATQASYDGRMLNWRFASNDVEAFYRNNLRKVGDGRHDLSFGAPHEFSSGGRHGVGEATVSVGSWDNALRSSIQERPNIEAHYGDIHVVGNNGTISTMDPAGHGVTFTPRTDGNGFDFVAGHAAGTITSDGNLDCPYDGHVTKTVRTAADAVGIVYGAPFTIININNGAATIPAPWPTETVIERCVDKCPTVKAPAKNLIAKKPWKPQKRKAKGAYCNLRKPTCVQDRAKLRKENQILKQKLEQMKSNKRSMLEVPAKETQAQQGDVKSTLQVVAEQLFASKVTNPVAAFRQASALVTALNAGQYITGVTAAQVIGLMVKAADSMTDRQAKETAHRRIQVLAAPKEAFKLAA
ncbi:MAG: hypothetical protein ABTQ34_08385 [Bdellovibrionales bacterium]